jgi:small subunit ribosomal protein S9
VVGRCVVEVQVAVIKSVSEKFHVRSKLHIWRPPPEQIVLAPASWSFTFNPSLKLSYIDSHHIDPRNFHELCVSGARGAMEKMARPLGSRATSALSSMCSHCRRQTIQSRAQQAKLSIAPYRRAFTTTQRSSAELEIHAAPEINLESKEARPARILPRSPSYFTASPVFNDHVLLLQSLVRKHQSLPTAAPSQIPRAAWLKLAQYRSSIGEQVAASKYSRVLLLLTRLNKIHPRVCPKEVRDILKYFRRPGAEAIKKAKPGTIDEHGRSIGIGRRKESSAKVYLVEGTGEVLINGRSVVQAFPRTHDRESALWALKITERMDKYNVFALATGGGVTGQAESITLALAKALLVHEPALKPALRRGKHCQLKDVVILANSHSSWLYFY